MDKSYLILTDSGGKTELTERIEARVSKIIRVDPDIIIVTEIRKLLEDKKAYQNMTTNVNPYGDGHLANRIVEIIFSKILS